MPQTNNQLVARQVERIVRQLTTLSTLPGVAAQLLTHLGQSGPSLSDLSEKIQSDPALTARVLSLAVRQGVQFDGEPSMDEAVRRLPLPLLREAVISVSVFQTLDIDDDPDSKRPLLRKQLALHSLAVACCAQQLADYVLEPGQCHLAYLAGLMHDIGKYALDEVMPKSFERMVQQAASERLNLADVEQEHLGLDHTILGKRLGQKWGLPEPVIAAVWLHHCDARTFSEMMPQMNVACVAALADRMVRRLELGSSGSYDVPDDVEQFCELLGLSPDSVSEISGNLPVTVREKSIALGLENADNAAHYYSVIRRTAVDLAEDNRRLSESCREGQAFDRQAMLISTFLDAVDEQASPVDLAEAFAAGWQRSFETGLCCVYTVGDSTEPFVELAVIDRQQHSQVQSLRLPDGMPPVPEVFRTKRSILPVSDAAKWLIEQLEADFDPAKMKMAPLRMADEVVAVAVFEQLRDTVGNDKEDDGLLCCKVAASAIAMAQAGRKHLELAEKFVRMMSSLRQARAELAKRQSLAGLAEMAAGAAHELNNPLSVISGRAQLLLASEDDESKKQMLRQMQERTEEMARIVGDLMAFARPAKPKKQAVSVAELVQHAIQQTCQDNRLATLETTISGAEAAGNVLADPGQIVQSLSYIITNALQSYRGDNGPVAIECSVLPDGGRAAIAIRDTGCGMDAETLNKATEPFFSWRPAGRRRGMGLAHAQRMLLLNGGDLKLASRPDAGTTVTVTLPKA